MLKKSIVLAAALLAMPALANNDPYNIYNQSNNAYGSSYKYDYKTGNSYSTTKGFGGQTQVRGYNYNTGSSWNTTIQKNGNQSGFDSKGNYWQYNNQTGTYLNSSGKMCTGKGAARICTGDD